MEPLSLPFAVSRNKGAYALLLGSGVSRTAGILTGWDITRDLIRQVALLKGRTFTLDEAEAWYVETFKQEPDYSDLLKELAKKPADRNAILRGYFVPTQEEREQNIKVPQDGHHAIAELVSSGHVRVIVTTNFDTLIEDALTQAGIDVQVISTADGIKGATPLPHAACTVFKVHGNYTDARIRNTKDELAKYPRALTKYLDRIFDEYGLIICGWSCEWDPALRAALERRPNRRYTTYWTHLSPLKEPALGLTAHLQAETIQIAGADQFFRSLTESMKAIANTAQPHPLSARVAEAQVKRYVVEDRYRILLADLVKREARRVHDATAWKTPNDAPLHMTPQAIEQRLAFYQSQTQTLMAMMSTGCYWGEKQHFSLWGKAVRRLSHFRILPGGHYDPIYYLQLYPAQLALYSGGLAAIAAERYDTLAALLLQDSWSDPHDNISLPMAMHLIPGRVLPNDLTAQLHSGQRPWTPSSDHLRWKSGIQEATHEVWMDDGNFDDLFDWFEFFLGLINWDLREKMGGSPWAYRGGYIWRENYSQDASTMKPVQHLNARLSTFGEKWAPLEAGFFSGSFERAIEVGSAYVQALQASRMSR